MNFVTIVAILLIVASLVFYILGNVAAGGILCLLALVAVASRELGK